MRNGIVEVYVHPVDFDAVRAYYRDRGVIEPQLVLVAHPTERWIAEPAQAEPDRYEEV